MCGGYFRNEKQWMVKQVDYENSDGKECSAFIVTKTDQIAPQRNTMRKELGIVIVLILVLTSLGLSFWIYRGVIGPLEQLKRRHRISKTEIWISLLNRAAWRRLMTSARTWWRCVSG